MPRQWGHVKWFDTAKGFGFIVSDEDGGDILLHANVLRNFGRGSVAEPARIECEVQETSRGRQASEVYAIELEESEEVNGEETAFQLPNIEGCPLMPARVKWFDKAKGFGFANTFGNSEDIFLHIEVLRLCGFSDLQPGEAITVRCTDGPRGKLAGAVYAWDRAIKEGVSA